MFVSNSDRPQWHHPNCFWAAMDCGSNTISVDLIDGIDTIMPDDQVSFFDSFLHVSVEKLVELKNLRNLTEDRLLESIFQFSSTIKAK